VSVRDFGSGEFEDVASVTQVASSAPAAASATNAAAAITKAAEPGKTHRLTMLVASFGAIITAASRLFVQDGATVILDVDIPVPAANLPQPTPILVPLPPGGIEGSVNTAMTVTLNAGGVGVVGKVSAAFITG
jgi:hypothetical protein